MSNDTSSPATDCLATPQCKDCTNSWINDFLEPSKTILNVERYAMLAAAFMLILTFLGTWRRRSRNLFVRYGVRGVYLLSFPLLSYTLGLMEGVIKNDLFPVWAVFLVVLLGGTSSMSVGNLDETKQWRKVLFEITLYESYLGVITAPFIFATGSKGYAAIVMFLILLLGLRHEGTMTALLLASDRRSSGSQIVAQHMTQLFINHPSPPRRSPYDYDPRSMQGYRYMVLPFRFRHDDNPPAAGRVVTLDEIWCHGNNGVLAMDDHDGDDSAIRYLKDLCLSFALFRLTVRRYFGYSCPESGLDMTRDLVLQGLLPRGEEDYGRAFQVIEAELAFLYDFFFTKYAAIMYRGVKMTLVLSLVTIVVIVGFAVYVLAHLNHSDSDANGVERLLESGIVSPRTQDILVTEILLCIVVVFQLLQVWLYCVSDWAKVSLAGNYLSQAQQTKTHRIGKLVLLMGKVSVFLERRRWFPHTENKMGQYSFLDSFHYPGHRFLEKGSVLVPMFRGGRKEGKSIPVPAEVKKAIARTLKDSNGHITNGASALQRHGMTGELYSWSCQTNGKFTLAHAMMVWHIATSYCDHFSPGMNSMPDGVQTSRIVATSLSKYCAYLVAFVPELLPGNPPETELMLDLLVLEARDVFSSAATSDKYEMLRELWSQGIHGRMLAKGAILGIKLESITNQGKRWRLLADFWAELMLHIAPSDNVSAHMEFLAQGGEFITHVWALLMHAGTLDRPAAAGVCAA